MLTLSRTSRSWRPLEMMPQREPSLRLSHSCTSEWGDDRLAPVTPAVRRSSGTFAPTRWIGRWFHWWEIGKEWPAGPSSAAAPSVRAVGVAVSVP